MTSLMPPLHSLTLKKETLTTFCICEVFDQFLISFSVVGGDNCLSRQVLFSFVGRVISYTALFVSVDFGLVVSLMAVSFIVYYCVKQQRPFNGL